MMSESNYNVTPTKVKFVVEAEQCTPTKAHEYDAGYDFKVMNFTAKDGGVYEQPTLGVEGDSEWSITMLPGSRVLFSTGVRCAVPSGYELQMRPRSGNAVKRGIEVVNSPGTIDCGYTGDIGIIIKNGSTETITVNQWDRMGQGVFCKLPDIELVQVDTLDDTERGDGGFGHTGVK
jgi:dUTP pyrophosphatase